MQPQERTASVRLPARLDGDGPPSGDCAPLRLFIPRSRLELQRFVGDRVIVEGAKLGALDLWIEPGDHRASGHVALDDQIVAGGGYDGAGRGNNHLGEAENAPSRTEAS
jgi:hypothetical protein